MFGQIQGRTLENYCHDKPGGCPLFDTKPENTSPLLFAAIDTAEMLRNYKERGCLPSINELTAWEFCAFDCAEAASAAIEAEEWERMEKEQQRNQRTGSGSDSRFAGPDNPDFGKIDNEGVFAGWEIE